MTDYNLTLSTTEANSVGMIKLRHADTNSQILKVQVIENGIAKKFTGLTPFFCLMAQSVTGQGVSEEPVKTFNSDKGTLEYIASDNALQMIGRNEAYFSFRKQTGTEWVEQFSTRSFYFVVEKSIYSQPFKDSNYWWTFKELNRIFNQYIEDGKNSWEEFVEYGKKSWEGFVEANREILESIDPNGTLLTKLQENKENIDSRGINVLLLGLKNDGTTDNSSVFNSVLNAITDGTKLFFPKGDYLFSNNISLNKQVHFEGIKPKYEGGDLSEGTVIRGGGLYFVSGSRYSTVRNIGVVNKSRPNGFDIRGNTGDITLDNCLSIGRDHCYLIESYLGEIANVKVTNCESFDGIHGFISKAKTTNFINCQALAGDSV
ncbi:BppU family phage baseplate upper protein [Lactococcus petauri]